MSSRLSSLACRAAAGVANRSAGRRSGGLFARPAAARPAPDSFADLAEKLLPSVVNISTTQTLKSGRGREHAGPEIPQFPPGSPFEEFFRDFFDHGMPRAAARRLSRARPPRSARALSSTPPATS